MPRGALTNWSDLSSITAPGPPLNVCGVQPQPGTTNIVIGRKAASAAAYVDPWFAPIVRPSSAAALAAPTADLAYALGGTSLLNNATAANLIPGPRGINFEGARLYLAYGSAAGTDVQDASGTYWARYCFLCSLSHTGTPSALSNAPRGAIDLKGYQSRIWLLGGVDDPGGGTTFNPLALFFTNPIGPGGGNAASFADWKDPVGGITNKIVMDGDTTDPGVGLAVVRNGLLIFRYASVWLLKGTTTANYALVPVSRDTGCVDPRSIVETDQGVYYMSRQGLMLTNGVTVKNVSGAVTHTLQNAVGLFTAAVKSSFGGYCTCALASGGQIVVSIGTASATSGAPDGHIQPLWCAMYDPSANAWTRVTSALFVADGTIIQSGNNYPGWVFNTPDRRLLSIGDKYITQWEAEASSTASAVLSTQAATSSASQSGAGPTWNNFSNVTGPPDGAYTAASFATVSNTISAVGYGFSVPASATITGIQVDITRASGTVGNQAADNVVQLLKAGVATGTNKALPSSTLWPRTLADQSYGGPSDLWGAIWAPSDVNNVNFGVSLQAQAPALNANARVDALQITVYYTLPNAHPQQSFVKQPALYDTDPAGAFQPIPFLWRTKLLPTVGITSMTRKNAQLKRWVADYVFQGVNLPSTKGFTVSLKDASGVLVTDPNAQVVLPLTNNSAVASSISGGPPNAATSIQRISSDCWAEVVDVCLEIAWIDAQQASAPSASIAEIYTAGIEFQHTSELR